MIEFRPARPADHDFVISTWSISYKKSHAAGLIYTDDWADVMRPQIKRIIDRPDATTIVACDSDDPDYLYGFISGDVTDDVPVVFYVYVKEPSRKEGIARGLFRALNVDPAGYFVYVSKTPMSIRLLSRINPRARFNPLEVRYPKESRRVPL